KDARLVASPAGDAGVLVDVARAGLRIDTQRLDRTDVETLGGRALEAWLLMELAAVGIRGLHRGVHLRGRVAEDPDARHIGEALAANRRPNDALDALETALAAGCRYRREWLEGNKSLASLVDSARFREIVARADARYRDAAAAARPKLMFAMPDEPPDAFGYPLLLVLHGNNSNASETAPHWSAMADAGWVVAVPQSSEIGPTPDAYTWNDRDRTAAELTTHLEKVKHSTQIDIGRIVLTGFSMGGTQAIALPLVGKIKVRGILPIAAWLPH